MTVDQSTADAFAESWNHLSEGSVYTFKQFEDWLSPLGSESFKNKEVLELGCGNGSLLIHALSFMPSKLVGVDLGDSVLSARKNLNKEITNGNVDIVQADLVDYRGSEFDLVYCIGVLHHLKNPQDGFNSVLENTKKGGKFHVWVYAWEGNFIVRWFVDPIRKISSRLPWWFTKYLVATPLVLPYFLYAKFIRMLNNIFVSFKKIGKYLPLYEYSLWISERDFYFFRHVAFDQLVTPSTVYIKRGQIESWLNDSRIDKDSTYIVFRNGNSWKFGGVRK